MYNKKYYKEAFLQVGIKSVAIFIKSKFHSKMAIIMIIIAKLCYFLSIY